METICRNCKTSSRLSVVCCSIASYCDSKCCEADSNHKLLCDHTKECSIFAETIRGILDLPSGEQLSEKNKIVLKDILKTLDEKFKTVGCQEYYKSIVASVQAIIDAENKSCTFHHLTIFFTNIHEKCAQECKKHNMRDPYEKICNDTFPIFHQHIIETLGANILTSENFSKITHAAYCKMYSVLPKNCDKNTIIAIQINLIRRAFLLVQNNKCNVCNETADKMCKRCSTPYCSESCQKIDWKHHKISCQ